MNSSNSSESGILERIDMSRLPVHVAVIMDGNGRWAAAKGLNRLDGHRRGVETTREIIEAANDLGIHVLTLYAFSTENWKRPRQEVFALMSLMTRYLRRETPALDGKNVRIRAVGDLSGIPQGARREFSRSMETTSGNSGLTLNIAVNYGARDEMRRGVKKIIDAVKSGMVKPEDITEETLRDFLDTAGLPDPDLLIRTGSEMRVSNFLLWQIAYAEFWVTPLLWPEFTKQDFYSAVLNYQQRKRRFGGLDG